MALAPVPFPKNRFHPFNFLQEEACARVRSAAEKLGFAACGKAPEDLEKDRIKGECLGCAVYAIVAGIVRLYDCKKESTQVQRDCRSTGSPVVLHVPSVTE